MSISMSIAKVNNYKFYRHLTTGHFIEKSTAKGLPGYGEWMVTHCITGEIIFEAKTRKECIIYCNNL